MSVLFDVVIAMSPFGIFLLCSGDGSPDNGRNLPGFTTTRTGDTMGCYNSTVVNVPIDDVWKMICNFHDLSWGQPIITKLEVAGDIPGDQIGAKRLLNDLFHETLLTFEPENYTFSYLITDGPEPLSKETVANYIGKVRLLPVTADNTTFVEWTASYESDQPDVVAEFVNPIYVGLLAALKLQFEN